MSGKARSFLVGSIVASMFLSGSMAHAVDVLGGVKFGYTSATLRGSNDSNIDARNGAVLGGVISWEVNRWFSAAFEPAFSWKGAGVPASAAPELMFPADINLIYLETAVSARFKWLRDEFSHSGLYGVVGISPGINTKARLESAGASTNISVDVTNFDFGIHFGGGYQIDADFGIVSFDLRYVLGLTNVFTNNAPQPNITGDLKNHSIQLTIGWVVGLI